MKNNQKYGTTSLGNVLGITLILLISAIIINGVTAVPAGPLISYVSNSTLASTNANRTQDAKGTITTLTMSLSQQDYKWKAYVGNVSGKFVLSDASTKAIYDWTLTSTSGKVFATRSSSTVNWLNVSCVNQSVVSNEETALGMSSAAIDNINSTFNLTVHKSFLIGTKNISNSTCKSAFTYINGAAQVVSESGFFQEVLLRDDLTSSLIYTSMLESKHAGYDGVNTFDFQMLVAENESSTTPTPYYFYVELG